MQVLIAPLLELGSERNVKDLILSALSREWPLTVRKLHNIVEKRGVSVSYHAVHKACQQLMHQGILKREKSGYLINIEWIEQISQLLEDMRRNYAGNRPMLLPGLKELKQKKETRTFVFENLAEADAYRKRLQDEYLNDTLPKAPFASMSRHLKSPLLYAEKAFKFAAKARGTAIYRLVACHTAPDDWCADYYRVQQQYVRTGVDCSETCDINVLGDVIVQVYTPDALRKRLDASYNGVRDVGEVSVPEFYRQICLSKYDVRLVVSWNPEIAEQLRRQVTGQFAGEQLALFDLENTLVPSGLLVDAIKHLQAVGLLNGGGQELVSMFEEFGAGKISRDQFVPIAVKKYAAAVKGQSASEVESAIRKFVSDHDTNVPFRYAPRLFYLLRSYRKMVAVTAFPEEFVRALEPLFVFDHTVCTRLEVKNGEFTGKVLQNLGTPQGKRSAFEAWMKSNGFGMEGSIGLGDRGDDLGFLEHVEFPVAINPDPKLAKLAKSRGWLACNGDDSDRLLGGVRAFLNGDTNGKR